MLNYEFRFIFGLFALIFIIPSCSKIDMYNDDVASLWHEDIIAYKEENITIDKVKVDDNRFVFSFSNGRKMGFADKMVSVITIDVRGFWRIDNRPTDKELEICSGVKMIRDGSIGSELTGIIEDYTDWSFVFKDKTSVTIKKTIFSYDADKRMRGINHRGYNKCVPENTLPAFRMSRLNGFTYVETDIRFTSDGVPVLLHDATVNRTSNGRGKVSDMSWQELQSLDFGFNFRDYKNTKIPSLDDFLVLCREIGLVPYLELKTGTEQQICRIVSMVKDYGLEGKTVYISFYDYLLGYVLKYNPSATVGLLSEYPDYETTICPALTLRSITDKVFIDSRDFGEETVNLCHDYGIPLEVWTVDASTIIKRLPDYVSGVTSNYLHAGRVLLGKE